MMPNLEGWQAWNDEQIVNALKVLQQHMVDENCLFLEMKVKGGSFTWKSEKDNGKYLKKQSNKLALKIFRDDMFDTFIYKTGLPSDEVLRKLELIILDHLKELEEE